MSTENLFRFFTVRPADQRIKPERASKTVPIYDAAEPTELGKRLQELTAAGASAAEVLRAVETYQASDRHVKTLEGLPFDIARALTWLAIHGNEPVAELDLDAQLHDLYGASPQTLVESSEYVVTRARLSDTIVAEAFRSSWERPVDGLVSARKLMAVIALAAAGKSLDPHATLGAAVAELTLSIPDFARLPAPPTSKPPEPPPPPTDEGVELRKRLQELELTHRELSRKTVDEDAVVQRTPKPVVSSHRLELEHRLASAEAARFVASPEGGMAARAQLPSFSGASDVASGGVRVSLTPDAIAGLSDTAQRVLERVQLDMTRVQPTVAVALLEEEMRVVSEQLSSGQQADTVLLLGGVMLDAAKARLSLLPHGRPWLEPAVGPCHFEAGIGDLLLVRQTLKAYELADFAHVENVLAGESREREHRRLNLREELVVAEEERETETERDLQSTERNEMQAEAEKTVKSQFELEAGLQVSGSYGPAVSFSASLNVGFSTSTEESQRKAVSYSREVTEKTSERVRERVRQETRRRMVEQVEELNRHSIVNTPATNGHVRGIYRWLNKVYDAQIFNYGQRMMFEFVVPEPAAYLIYALIENPPKDSELIKPVPPTRYGAPLKPSHITRTNYLDWVAKYQVRNVPAPPPEFQDASVFDKQDRVQDGSDFGRSTKAEIPSGYEAYAATVMADYIFTSGQSHHFRVMVGGTDFDVSNYWGSTYRSLSRRYRELGIAYHLWRAWSFALAIDIHCRLTAEGLAKWQQQVYDAIMEAYLQQKADYEERLAALEIQQGVKILGRNPLENRRIEREELKKLVLMMLTRSVDIARDSMQPGTEPNIDLRRACAHGSFIRFFENAFEWNNLLYVLYSYFWGRKPRWISALHFTDPDPEFAAFLKAGAARVQVPVRPGFERAVAHYCQFGEIWEGNDPPLRDDDLYVPIVEELAANLGKLDEGVPYPPDAEPWEVRVPTSLVLVQNLEEIPGITDVLTGNDVDITP